MSPRGPADPTVAVTERERMAPAPLALLSRAWRLSFTFAGRSRRSELAAALVLPELPLLALGLPLRWTAAPDVAALVTMALSWLVLIPLPALVVRRLHDAGLSGRWGLPLLAVALRLLLLDLVGLAGGKARALVEAPLSWVDWLLFLPTTLLVVALALTPARASAVRFGADPRHG